MEKKNIVLIGMPGAGKSTVGVLLAKALGMPFIDTDLLIQQREGAKLQEIINNKGIGGFLRCEERAILSLDCSGHVIATGGSVIYSTNSIAHLKAAGVLFYLKLPYRKIESRIRNIKTRGIVSGNNQTLYDLYMERTPLYEKYADITIICSNKHIEQVVSEIISESEKFF